MNIRKIACFIALLALCPTVAMAGGPSSISPHSERMATVTIPRVRVPRTCDTGNAFAEIIPRIDHDWAIEGYQVLHAYALMDYSANRHLDQTLAIKGGGHRIAKVCIYFIIRSDHHALLLRADFISKFNSRALRTVSFKRLGSFVRR